MATELVQAFNAELASLYESKPPISKAKMSSITKTAIRGIKMYKHVVQSVERFIAKCRPEYKLPGLYVIDSIVRQSRHQWGPDKDVFGPRFMRNFHQTFANLFSSCPSGDKPKIVRVLNLWQRNSVFTTDVIQPLLDMANPNMKTDTNQVSDGKNDPEVLRNLNQLAATLGLKNNGNNSTATSSNNVQGGQAKIPFNRDILKYDYSDDEDGDGGGETPTEAEPPTSSMTASHQAAQQQPSTSNDTESESNPLAWTMAQNLLLNPEILQRLQRIQQGKEQSDSQSRGRVNVVDDVSTGSFKVNEVIENKYSTENPIVESVFQSDQDHRGVDRFGERRPVAERRWDRKSRFDSDEVSSRRKRSRSRSRSPARSRDRRDGDRRSRRSPDRSRYQEREPSPGEIKREKERDRRKRGLPPLKPGYMTICSTTLWLGHVPKLASEADISDAFGEFGTISSIELIPPRGCAYVCMNSRQDAYRILTNSSKGLKLHGSSIKMAWAPGKGTKGKEFKEFWEVDVGSSYIPWDRLPPNIDLDPLEEGGMIDEESLPAHLIEMKKQKMIQRLEQEKADQLLKEQMIAAEKLKNEAEAQAAAMLAQTPIPTPLVPPSAPSMNVVQPPLMIPPSAPQVPSLNPAGIPGLMSGPPPPMPPPGAIPLDQFKNMVSYPIQQTLNKFQSPSSKPSIPPSQPLLPSPSPGHLAMSGPPPPLAVYSGPPLAVPPPQVLSGHPPPPLPWGNRPPPSGPPPSSLTGPNAQPISYPHRAPMINPMVIPPLAPHLKPAVPPPNSSMSLPSRIHPVNLPQALHENDRPSANDDPFAPSLYELKNMNRGRQGPPFPPEGGRPPMGRFEDGNNFRGRSRFSDGGNSGGGPMRGPRNSWGDGPRNDWRRNQNDNFRDGRGNDNNNSNQGSSWQRNDAMNKSESPQREPQKMNDELKPEPGVVEVKDDTASPEVHNSDNNSMEMDSASSDPVDLGNNDNSEEILSDERGN